MPYSSCQAEGCSLHPEFVCEAWIMTPPTPNFEASEVWLCEQHTMRFEGGEELSVLLDPTNEDRLSVARWRA